MAELQNFQANELRQIYAQMHKEAEKIDALMTPETVAPLLMKVCLDRGDELPAERYRRYEQYFREIMRGYKAFRQFHDELVMDGLPLDIRQMYGLLTRAMSSMERMGLYLQCYESNRTYSARFAPDLKDAASAADLAVLDENHLVGVISEQTELLTEYLILSTFEKGRPPENLQTLVHSENEALLFAAAILAAAENGTLPQELGAYPQLLGIGAACGTAIMCQDWTEEGNGSWERVAAALVGVAVALAIIAATVGPAWFLVSAEPVNIILECVVCIISSLSITSIVAGPLASELAYKDWLPRLRGFYRMLKDPNRKEMLSASESTYRPVLEQPEVMEQIN